MSLLDWYRATFDGLERRNIRWIGVPMMLALAVACFLKACHG